MMEPRANQLLSALPEPDYQRWAALLEEVDMPLGQVLYESGGTPSHVCFPITSIVAFVYVLENGASAEIAVVGNEGVVGVSLFMGGNSTLSRAVVQSAGGGFRLPANALLEAFEQGGPVSHLLLRYTQALITQMAQTAVCNRHHNVQQQLCRWLLLSLDRLATNELLMTQELIANMLGVRREGVTEAALALQKAGLIRYTGIREAASRLLTARRSKDAVASVMRSSSRNTTACSRTSRPLRASPSRHTSA